MKNLITKRHIGRPITLLVGSGRSKQSHGRIAAVARGIATIDNVYVNGCYGPDNGQYVCRISVRDKNVIVY